VIYCVLKEGKPYQEPNSDELQARERKKQVQHHARRLRQLGADTAEVEQLVVSVLAKALDSSKLAIPSARRHNPRRSRAPISSDGGTTITTSSRVQTTGAAFSGSAFERHRSIDIQLRKTLRPRNRRRLDLKERRRQKHQNRDHRDHRRVFSRQRDTSGSSE
jgi:hypothetical protein